MLSWHSGPCMLNKVDRAPNLKYTQVKYVAAPPKPKDMTSLIAKGLFVHYSVLAKGSYTLFE